MFYSIIVFLIVFSPRAGASQTGPPKPFGHSHNDYMQARPLWDALENRFISIEADIHLVGDALLVGHDEEDLDADRTLQSLYLNPLRSYIKDNNASVYPEQELILLIDIKTDADSTYRQLRQELAAYSDILTSYRAAGEIRRAVSVVISGNRARELMLAEDVRYATYDGRLDDLSNEMTPHFMIMISANWEDHFNWRGQGRMSSAELAKLTAIINSAHTRGYKIRFWNLPADEPANRQVVWQRLMLLGVDLINVDDLSAYRDFVNKVYAQ